MIAFMTAMGTPHWQLIVAVVALLQWLVLAGLALVSSEKFPKDGFRSAERNLIISTAAVVIVWLVAFDARSIAFGPPKSETAAMTAADSGGGSGATCASVQLGMYGSQVKSKLGDPTQVISEEDTRGPGAKLWFFKKSRCAVHMLDDIVELTE